MGGKDHNHSIPFTSTDINSFFTNLFVTSVIIPIPDSNFLFDYHLSTNLFEFNTVSEEDVLKSLASIHSYAVGSDGISLQFLKIVLPYILQFVTELINDCIVRSVFPDNWKKAIVIPLAKVNKVSSLSDLRPISITPVMSKMFEILLKNQMELYLNINRFVDKLQSGFRVRHSTTTAMVNVVDDLASVLDKPNSFAVLVIIDFSKAFDCINHMLLLQKLMLFFNFYTTSIKLIRSFLFNRSQRVELNGDSSEFKEISSGVPQGSILGPLLFSMYINDLSQHLQYAKYHLYADDCQLYIGGCVNDMPSIIEQLNLDLENVYRWSTSNGLQLNASKSKALLLSKNKSLSFPVVSINGAQIPFSGCLKNLGLIIDGTLSWKDHIKNLCKRLNSILYGLKLQRRLCSRELRIYLVKTLIVPHINYCDVVYSNCDASSKHLLHVAYNNAIRYIYDLKWNDHVSMFYESVLGFNLDLYFK